MAIRSRTSNERPGKPAKSAPMFAKTNTGGEKHKELLATSSKVHQEVKPKRGTTKTLAR